jgi:transcriptional regulator with XRE-family HTH domain
MWLDKLKDLKKQSGMSAKLIAEKANMSERTVTRILNGETYAPGIDKLRDIVYAMGGSLDDILDESDFKLPTPMVEALKTENATLQNAVNDLTAENVTLKDKIVALEVELDRLRLTLAHKEDLLAHKEEIVTLQKKLLGVYQSSASDKYNWGL